MLPIRVSARTPLVTKPHALHGGTARCGPATVFVVYQNDEILRARENRPVFSEIPASFPTSMFLPSDMRHCFEGMHNYTFYVCMYICTSARFHDTQMRP